ncbi:hypothetical protein [Nocardioides pinisoli]|uniref:Uncharacterized protein n=1 Tax=Nocardioides pinisoli TaxID=2950279 RepID=A0ABT1KSH3_9ACTN|nr:hypothetical protein [Nocardioides pinisoli]MCP3420339.1 hypothetical protein [Nocardioides pinisoli]
MHALTRLATTIAFAAVALFIGAAPGNAVDHPPADIWVYATGDASCYTTPNAYGGREARVKPLLGSLYQASSMRVDGVDIMNGETTFRWVEVEPGVGCYQPAGWLSSPVDPALLDVNTFTNHAIGAPPAEGFGLGAALSLADRVVMAAPALDSAELGEIAEGQVLSTNDLIVKAPRGLLGMVAWRAVEFEGQLGWMLASSLTDVPDLAVEDLTSIVTPRWDVTAWTLPGAGEEVGELPAGAPTPASLSATAGWMPVEMAGQVAWVRQADLTTDPNDAPTASPTEAEVGESAADVIEQLRVEATAKREEHEKARAAEQAASNESGSSLWATVKAKVSGENPVAEAVASARLRLAMVLGALALLLAAGAHAGTMWLRGHRGLLARTTSTLFPAVTVAAHASLLTAIGVATWAASTAPSVYFTGRVLIVAAAGGLALAWVTAHRVAAMRGADWKLPLGALLLVGGSLFVFGAPLAVALLLGLVVAGGAAGSRTSNTGERDAAAPHTHAETAPPARTEV